MKNLLSYCGLVDARISASEKDLPFESMYYLLIDEKQDNYMAQFQTNYPNYLTPKSEKVNL